MDRRLFLKGASVGIAGLSLPVTASPAWSPPSVAPGKSLWSGSNGRSAGSCKVIGIGGAGCNIVLAAWSSAVWENADQRPEFCCVDLGEQALRYVAAASEDNSERAPIKTISLAPFGAGGWVNVARAMALRQRQALQALVAHADKIVLVAGLGGGTGSGVTPIMARLARESGALTIAAVVTPCRYEGVRRRIANSALGYLKREAVLLMGFSNEEWEQHFSDDASYIDVFTSLDRHIANHIHDLIVATSSTLLVGG